MHKSRFWLPELIGNAFEGWTDGSNWNGWATPYFEQETGIMIVNAFDKLPWLSREKAWFDADKEEFHFIMDGGPEPECYPSEMIDVDGRQIKLYPTGTRVWIWEEYKEEA